MGNKGSGMYFGSTEMNGNYNVNINGLDPEIASMVGLKDRTPKKKVKIKKTKKVVNKINIRRDSITLKRDKERGMFTLSFVYDSSVDVLLRFFFFATDIQTKKGNVKKFKSLQDTDLNNYRFFLDKGFDQKFSLSFPDGEILELAKDSFKKHYVFYQNISTRIRRLKKLDKDYVEKWNFDIIPLVIVMEDSSNVDKEEIERHPNVLVNVDYQETYCSFAIDKKTKEFYIKVLMQKITISGRTFKVQKIYGNGPEHQAKKSKKEEKKETGTEESDNEDGGSNTSSPSSSEESEAAGGKVESSSETQFDECVICMAAKPTTMILPCRHLILCSECAKTFKDKMTTCPICRGPIESLVEL